VAEQGAPNEQQRPSHAAAPAARPIKMAPSCEGSYRGWTGGFLSGAFIKASRIGGDLGTARVPERNDMTKRPTINEALRLLRLYCRYSQAEMAAKLGVAQSLVSDIENANKSVSMDLLAAYSEAMDIKMSQLLFFAEEIEGQPIARRGQLIIAEKVLQLLENLRPAERDKA
jgi:transcriptional regulator with XRE-family HTH domain